MEGYRRLYKHKRRGQKVEIGDITGDGVNEVIVGWTDNAGTVCTLSAYTIGEKLLPR